MGANRMAVTVIAAACLALAGAGCGDDDEDKGAAKTAAAEPAKVDLASFLMQDGEEPGFRAEGEPRRLTGLDAFVKDMGLTDADAARLRRDGHVSFVAQPIHGPRTAGISNVQLFKTAEGAQRSLAYELQPSVIKSVGPAKNVRFFDVPGVPGARGWTASIPDNDGVANALWVQGRCMLVLGNQGEGDLTGRLAKGVKAIYDRTKGECP